METLAIIAYRQPITRSEIEFVRGVNVDYIVNSLLKRDLIMIKGRQNSPGSPILYGTTDQFLKVLGLNNLTDLPKLREINEILKTEKIEGITEADLDLFNSINLPSSEEKPKEQEEINFAATEDETQTENPMTISDESTENPQIESEPKQNEDGISDENK